MTAQTRSVELLKAVRIEGDACEPGDEITVRVDMAADLVHRGCARYSIESAAPAAIVSSESFTDPANSGDYVASD